VLGRAISGMLLSALSSAVLVLVGLLLFGASLSDGLLLAIPALVIASISMIGVGYLVAAAVLLMREPNFFVDATNFLFAMVSGVAFPVLVLPAIVQPLAYVLPTTYAVDLLRVYALGTRPLVDPLLEWAALIVLAAVAIWLGRAAFARTERRMRVKGTLGQH
jgi:ABC-2 type transport system permease protein